MEAHYIAHDFFLQPDQLLRNAGKLRGIPGAIIQGRYDLLCPPRTAHAIAAAWPDCTLQILDTAGHAMSEPGVMEAMKRALKSLPGSDPAGPTPCANAPARGQTRGV